MTARLLASAPVVLRDVPLSIDPAEVRAFQSYMPPLGLPDLAARLDAARREIEAITEPRLSYRTIPVVEREPDGLMLSDGTRLRIPGIARHWGPVDAVVVAVVTIGEAAEALVDRRGAVDAIAGTLLDSAASAAVECLAEWANDYVCQLGVAANLRVTNRISPGFAGWSLADQATLLRLCPAAEVGVRLAPDGTMTPAKSISLLVGIGPAARVDHYFVQCRRCWAEGCPARRMAPTAAVGHGRR
ncbi:MAG: hypothetical protein ACRELA_18560 [Candidatus Rokuibacteriota bacterium]